MGNRRRKEERVTEGVNAISVLGRDLLLVEVGVGAEIHLAAEAEDGSGRPAVERDRYEDGSWTSVPTIVLYDDAALSAQRWEEATLCGRRWQAMAAGESGPIRLWRDTALAPTCRSCLRVLDKRFPQPEAPTGVDLLASIIAEAVQEFGSTMVTNVPAEHLEATRRAARKHLRAKGFRSTTHVVNGVLHVLSDDASDAIDPDVKRSWFDASMARAMGTESSTSAELPRTQPIDWYTWVSDA